MKILTGRRRYMSAIQLRGWSLVSPDSFSVVMYHSSVTSAMIRPLAWRGESFRHVSYSRPWWRRPRFTSPALRSFWP